MGMDVARLEKVELVGEKWGGGPHYAGLVYVLGDDRHGTWLWGPAGRTVSRGGVPVFRSEQDLIAVAPTGEWWMATWWVGHPEVELYVNINTPVERSAAAIRYVDLDLDVVRLVDGACDIVDRDEFELHQVDLGYPPEITSAAATAADEVLSAVASGAPPFDGSAARRWTDAARAARLPAV